MPSLKLDVRTASVSGSPDLVSFFTKGSALPAGVPDAEFDGGAGSTVLLRDKHQRTLVAGVGEKGKIEPTRCAKPPAQRSRRCSSSARPTSRSICPRSPSTPALRSRARFSPAISSTASARTQARTSAAC
jgi:hypothetical protein